MKKIYKTPELKVFRVKIRQILAGSGNSNMNYTSSKGDNTQPVLAPSMGGVLVDDEME